MKPAFSQLFQHIARAMPPLLVTASTLALFGCGTAPVLGSRHAPVMTRMDIKRNSATYYSGEGGLVIRGFASGDLVTCVAPPVQSVRTIKSSNSAKGKGGYKGAEISGERAETLETSITEVNDYTSVDAMTRVALSEACFLYGNGGFGNVVCYRKPGTDPSGEPPPYVSSAGLTRKQRTAYQVPCEETHQRYLSFVSQILDAGMKCAGHGKGSASCSFIPAKNTVTAEYVDARKAGVEAKLADVTAEVSKKEKKRSDLETLLGAEGIDPKVKSLLLQEKTSLELDLGRLERETSDLQEAKGILGN